MSTPLRRRLLRVVAAGALATALALGGPSVAGATPTAPPLSGPSSTPRTATDPTPGCGTRGFRQDLHRHLQSLRTRDLARFAATVHPQVVLVLPSGSIVAGKPAVVAFHRDFFADPSWEQTYDQQFCAVSGHTATVLLATHFVQREDGVVVYESRNLLGLTFTRWHGRWVLVHDQNTRLP